MTGEALLESAREDAFSDGARTELAAQLNNLRQVPGCPTGSDEAILAMSNSPGHTGCPNPFVAAWLSRQRVDEDRPDPGPFASDTTAGKTTLVYKAHSYPPDQGAARGDHAASPPLHTPR